LRLQAAGAQREVEETKLTAMGLTQQAKVGSAGADLLSANLDAVHELLITSGLGKLCDGSFRSGDDPLVKSVAAAFQSTDAARIFSNANWLQVQLKGKGDKPIRTIGTVVRCLGGVSDSRREGPRGAQLKRYRWILPGEW
jgi:hypothetical protein